MRLLLRLLALLAKRLLAMLALLAGRLLAQGGLLGRLPGRRLPLELFLLTEIFVVSFVRHADTPRVSPAFALRLEKPGAGGNRSARAPVDATNRRP
jgi:hypothetical protein